MSSTAANTLTVTLTSELEVTLTREFQASRQRVFEAWTQPEHVARWWGQDGSTLTLCEIDLRPGGAWRYVERSADGNEYPFCGEYLEVDAPERLVHTFVFDVEPFNARPATVTVVFEDLGDRSRVAETTRFQTVEDRDAMIDAGMEDGARQALDRLESLLQEVR